MVRRYIPDRGDLVWISLDPSIGHEQKGRRPALVLSPKLVNARSGLAFMCPITSLCKGYPFEVPLVEDTIKGAVLADHIRSVDWESRQISFAGHVNPGTLALVQDYIVALITGEN